MFDPGLPVTTMLITLNGILSLPETTAFTERVKKKGESPMKISSSFKNENI